MDQTEGLTIRYDAAAPRVVSGKLGLVTELPLTVLAGPREVELCSGGTVRREGDFHLLESPDRVAGVVLGRPGAAPEAEARRLYDELLRVTGGHHLYRVWNYLPEINRVVDGTENYRAFNAGRQAAFVARYGNEYRRHIPAASALGTPGDRMVLVFMAGTALPQYWENPQQVPACEYPPRWGRVPPAFARGCSMEDDSGGAWHLAGTASVVGSETSGATFAEQLKVMLENIGLMLNRMAVPRHRTAHWRVFLRRPEDLAECRAGFARTFAGELDHITFMHTGICRSCLLVETEAVFLTPAARAKVDEVEALMASAG